jgi:hypothetical protein
LEQDPGRQITALSNLAVGRDWPPSRQLGKPRAQLVDWDIHCVGDMAFGKFLGRADVERQRPFGSWCC